MATPEDHSYEMASAYDVKKPLNLANVASEAEQAALEKKTSDQMTDSVKKALAAQALGNNEQSIGKEGAL